MKIIIGSRGSELALWQANFVLEKLKETGISASIKIIKTKGDLVQNLSWDKMEGKGFFTKEIEDALLRKEIDLAVHSHKDLPTEITEGLVIAAVSGREDPSELLLINKNAIDETAKFSLKKNAVVGTSSARRKSQLLAWRSDLQLLDLRGNIPTRIQKLREKKYDAILIANAGVSRLDLDVSEFHSEKLDPREFIPAPAQGVLALQIRQNDKKLFDVLQKINNKETEEIVSIERKVMNLFDGGCQLPLGVFCNADFQYAHNGEEKIFKTYVSIAEKWNSFPKYFYFETKKPEGFAERIVEKIRLSNSKERGVKVFISRNEKKNDFLKNCLEAHGYKVFFQSLIEIKPVPFNKNFQADWIFFSSKNAVKYFFEQNPKTDGMKIGAVGKVTADEIRKFGKRADFIGSSDDTKMTGKKFSALVGNKKVLFPQAKQSMKTIQLQIPKHNVIDLVVYETIQNSTTCLTAVRFKIQHSKFNLFVFTSPSNVDAFCKKNKIQPHQKVVAMGDATANALRKYGIKANKQPPSFDDLGLVMAIMSI